jgi:hypothetical protein
LNNSAEILKKEDLAPIPSEALDGFDLLVGFALVRRIPVYSQMLPGLKSADGDFVDKFYWRAGEIYATRSPETGKVDASTVVHSAIHSLMVSRYGDELRSRPLITLLAEALASNADLFWNLQLKQGGLLADNNWYANQKHSVQKIHGVTDPAEYLVEILSEGLRDPFTLYKNAVLEMFETYCFMLKGARAREKRQDLDFKSALAERLKTNKYSSLYFHYDLSGNLLYALAWCGFDSDETDQSNVADCVEKLRRAAKMSDFLSSLEIARYHGLQQTG